MRAKLLRALAHLKAAAEHVKAAEAILDRNYRGGLDDCAAARDGVAETSKHLGEVYAKAVFEMLEPAELP